MLALYVYQKMVYCEALSSPLFLLQMQCTPSQRCRPFCTGFVSSSCPFALCSAALSPVNGTAAAHTVDRSRRQLSRRIILQLVFLFVCARVCVFFTYMKSIFMKFCFDHYYWAFYRIHLLNSTSPLHPSNISRDSSSV